MRLTTHILINLSPFLHLHVAILTIHVCCHPKS